MGDDRPTFIYAMTASTHVPFATHDDDYDSEHPALNSSSQVYMFNRALRYADEQIGWFVDQLRARPRPTVVFVVGDHGYPLASAHEYAPDPGVRDMPCDHRAWVGALLTHLPGAGSSQSQPAGDSHPLHGAAGIDDRPASSVDIMPTLLQLIGDERPTASLGRSLLAPGPRSCQCVRHWTAAYRAKSHVVLSPPTRPIYADPMGDFVDRR